MSTSRSTFWHAWMGLAPVAVLAVTLFVPVTASAVNSFRNWNRMEQLGWSFDGYLKVIQPHYLKMFFWIAVRAVVVATVSVGLAVPLAYYVTQRSRPWVRRTLLFAITVPFFVNDSTKAFGWRFVLDHGGFLHRTVKAIGLTADEWQLPGAIVVGVVLVANTLPVCVLPITFCLPRRQDNIWTVCDDFGTSQFSRFYHVVIPLATKGAVAGWMCAVALAFGASVEASILERPMEVSLRRVIQDIEATNGFSAPHALGSMIQFALLFIGVIVASSNIRRAISSISSATGKMTTACGAWLTSRIARTYLKLPRDLRQFISTQRLQLRSESSEHKSQRSPLVWAWLVHFWVAVLLVAILAPLVAIAARSFSHMSATTTAGELVSAYTKLASDDRCRLAFWNSALLALGVGIAVAPISFMIAFTWWNHVWRKVTVLALVLLAVIPADVYANSTISFARALGMTQGALVLCGVAHIGWALPFSAAPVFIANSRIGSNLLCSGLEFGCTRIEVIFRIILPLIWRALASSALVGMLFSFNDYARTKHLCGAADTIGEYVYGKMASGTDTRVFALATVNVSIAVLALGGSLLLMFVGQRLNRSAR